MPNDMFGQSPEPRQHAQSGSLVLRHQTGVARQVRTKDGCEPPQDRSRGIRFHHRTLMTLATSGPGLRFHYGSWRRLAERVDQILGKVPGLGRAGERTRGRARRVRSRDRFSATMARLWPCVEDNALGAADGLHWACATPHRRWCGRSDSGSSRSARRTTSGVRRLRHACYSMISSALAKRLRETSSPIACAVLRLIAVQ